MTKIYYNDKGVQLGNLLYLCLQVYKDRQKGEESYILKTGWYKQAIAMFPNLETYFNKANGKPVIPFKTSYYQKHGEDFTSQELDGFCTQVLLPGIDAIMNHIAKKDVVICVRRGDMYAEHQKYHYGFDVIDYVNTALKHVEKQQTVRIASDDIDWCHEHLQLEEFVNIEFCQTDRVDNFWQMVQTAQTLIIPNSTFAYWAAYLVRLLKPQVSIIAPNFNTYLIENGQQIADTRNWDLIDVTTELSKLKIGVFYVATGNYTQFFDEFYKTAKENLLTDCQVTYYVYTDNVAYFDKYSVNGDVVLSFVEHKPFPYPTLYRYHFFDKNKINWSKENYMLFFNANTVFSDKVSVSVLPTSNQLKVWTLPVNQNLAYEALDFEKNPQSCAYVPKIDGQTYVCTRRIFMCDCCIIPEFYK